MQSARLLQGRCSARATKCPAVNLCEVHQAMRASESNHRSLHVFDVVLLPVVAVSPQAHVSLIGRERRCSLKVNQRVLSHPLNIKGSEDESTHVVIFACSTSVDVHIKHSGIAFIGRKSGKFLSAHWRTLHRPRFRTHGSPLENA